MENKDKWPKRVAALTFNGWKWRKRNLHDVEGWEWYKGDEIYYVGGDVSNLPGVNGRLSEIADKLVEDVFSGDHEVETCYP